MNKYELTLILPGKATPAKKKSVLEKIDKMVSAIKGKIEKVDEWGKMNLMYPIRKNDNGIFILYNIELNPSEVKKFSEKLKTEEEILRFLIVKL